VARCERRSFAADCAAMIAALPSPPIVRGLEHVPRAGPLAVVSNHYQRPELWIGWAGALLANSVGRVRSGDPPLHLLVVDGWPATALGRTFALPGSRWVFTRVARAWSMVPIPLDPSNHAGRARALRDLAAHALAGRAVALFPEGERGRAGEPAEALPGAGRWLRLQIRAGVVVVPAAVAETGGTLAVAFGPPLDQEQARDPMPAVRSLYHGLLACEAPEARR
jgi:hypothetical protein